MKIESAKPSKHSQLSWYDTILLRVIPPIVAFLVKLLLLSCRVIKVEGKEWENEARRKTTGGLIYVTWHQRMSYHAHYFGARHVTVMISQSRDGEYATRMAKWLGFKNVRGSSTRGGRAALKELIQRIKNGEIGGMLADGPLGPARVAKKGSVIMARNTHSPLIPLLWGADRCWMLNSWDKYMIPKPFARIVFYYGEPIWVPASTGKDELETFRRVLEERLNTGASWCDAHFGPDRPWRKVKEKGVPEVGPLDPS
jgi:lysophospholipid acyltransferase (LPLAT)-like uncharacterized protein